MLWIILAVSVWGLVHSLLASRSAKLLARQVFGQTADRFYRLAYNLLACITYLPVLVFLVTLPDQRLFLVPLPWSILMVLGQILAGAALLIGFGQTDVWEFAGLKQATGSSRIEKPGSSQESQQGKLVTKGLYKYVRHPLYSAGIAFIWLMPLMTVNTLAHNATLTAYIFVGAIFEEAKLRHEYGQVYADYCAVTPMLIPFSKWNKAHRKPSI